MNYYFLKMAKSGYRRKQRKDKGMKRTTPYKKHESPRKERKDKGVKRGRRGLLGIGGSYFDE